MTDWLPVVAVWLLAAVMTSRFREANAALYRRIRRQEGQDR